MVLNLLDIERHGTRALGPGLRYVIWTQGCPFNCPKCITPEGRPIVSAKLADTVQLANDIIANKTIEGITISGGEPFLQATSVAELLKTVKEHRPKLNIIIFTGFLKENLLSDDAQSILSMTDLLIDGPYMEALNDGVGLRGSSNQRLHFLTDRLLPYKMELLTGKRQIEITINNHHSDAIGIPLNQNVL
ncbi:4Fe-4S single cluster domain-containing protein [Prevotella sp. tf2-5]|uniref:4Fe-4S single cluster domain-containing protein n=1 Tax=Prevotella sp. tf2-5 TaxID=1761889 RepID=UPI0008F2F25D|nr:4Fe-4S single cluster domain-containing protein [Prevotella sp. tf2-5]SFP14520.1 anaerobic ribonucleoside-triphosphate reductase activating protein [Prevotella sp. tf2-5]